MAASRIDRRSARTRARLQQAHKSLLLKKGYEAITIKDICDVANVGRSTFYAHYAGKDDLKRSGLEQLRRQLMERQKQALAAPRPLRERSLGFSLSMFEHARDHIDLYRALAGGRGGEVALGAIRKILADLVRYELVATNGTEAADAIPREVVVEYVVGAYMSVLTWWLDSGAKLPAERIDAMFRRLAIDGIAPSPSDRSRPQRS
jgi:AcrR family transcriptional regulator